MQSKARATDAKFHPTDKDLSVGIPGLERAVALMDSLFVIDRAAREQKRSLDDRRATSKSSADMTSKLVYSNSGNALVSCL